MAKPASLAAINLEIEANRRESVEELRERVGKRRLDRSEGLELHDRIRNAYELIQFIEEHGIDGIRERRLEEKYGTGLIGRWRRFMAGEYDVTIDEDGQVRHNYIAELGRRTLRSVFNRKTLFGGLALGVIGGLSGGLGALGLPALYSFMGTVAGGATAEGISLASGAERRARARLKRAEYDEAYEIEELAVRYHDEPDAEKRAQIALQIIGHFHQAADTALGALGAERQRAAKQLAEVQKKQANLREILQLTGTVAGVGWGFAAAHSLAASGLPTAGEGFGAVDADWDGIFHQVAQQNGEWHYLYNSISEAGAAVDAGNTVVATLGQHGGHIITSDPWFGAKVYGWAGARALGIIGAMYAGGGLAGLAIDAAEHSQKKGFEEEEKASYERIKATVEAARPVVEEKAGEPIETAVGTILPVIGLREQLPGGQFEAYFAPEPGKGGLGRLKSEAWDPAWRYLRLAEHQPARGSQPECYRIELFSDPSVLRAGTPGISYLVRPEVYAALFTAARALHPIRPLPRGEQAKLIELEKNTGLKDMVGKLLTFRSGVKAEHLRILMTPNGDPRPGNLDPKVRYELVSYDTERDLATVRNVKTGDTQTVGLAALCDRIVPARASTGAPAAPSIGGLTAEAAGRVGVSPATSATTSEEPRRSWKQVVEDLEIRGEPRPKKDDIWVVTNELTARVASGRNKGDEETLEVGGRYQIRSTDQKTGRVVVVPAAGGEPLELHIEDFDGNLRAEKSLIAEILADKERSGEPIPRNEQISPNQRWRYQYADPTGKTPDDAAPVEYRVDGFGRGGSVRLVNPAAPAGPTQLRFVSPLDLAEKGEFIP